MSSGANIHMSSFDTSGPVSALTTVASYTGNIFQILYMKSISSYMDICVSDIIYMIRHTRN